LSNPIKASFYKEFSVGQLIDLDEKISSFNLSLVLSSTLKVNMGSENILN
jgi:hypothetical protein